MNAIAQPTSEAALASGSAPQTLLAQAPASPAPAPAAAPAGGDPWSDASASATTTDDAASAWGAPDPAAGADWLAPPADAEAIAAANTFELHQLWDGTLPLDRWINQGLEWTVDHFRPAFQAVRGPIDSTLAGVTNLLQGMPPSLLIGLAGLLAWQFAGRGIAVGTVVSLLMVAGLGIWSEAMVTLSLVLTSLAFCLVIGLPLGILLAASDRAQRLLRPILDAMQTTPAFVYLVPVVMLFGIGNVPGVIVTIVFALPPLVRLTALGIRQVRPDLIEAARAYGASPWQLLMKVQLPLAMPSIMAGVNQALMLALSMVVIASMIAVGGLGQMVLRGIGRLDMGLATVGGLGIVLLAISLDRITQSMGRPRRGSRRWWRGGPVGMALALMPRRAQRVAPAPVGATASAAEPKGQAAGA